MFLVQSPGELSAVLLNQVRPSLESGDVKLIVMDSVAAMYRTEQSANAKEPDFHERFVASRQRLKNAACVFLILSLRALIVCRSQDLLRMAAQLKQYSSTYHIPIVIINQVSDFFSGADQNGGQALRIEEVKHSFQHHWAMMSSGRPVIPALGLTWANCVTTRIFLTRKHEFVAGQCNAK